VNWGSLNNNNLIVILLVFSFTKVGASLFASNIGSGHFIGKDDKPFLFINIKIQ
jgi:hypothetical protein